MQLPVTQVAMGRACSLARLAGFEQKCFLPSHSTRWVPVGILKKTGKVVVLFSINNKSSVNLPYLKPKQRKRAFGDHL